MDIENDLDVIMNQMIIGANRFEKIYNFPTENLRDSLSKYDFKDKNCLTTMGSSFQMIEMYLKGAKKVTTFDINVLTIYYFYLVKSFLKSNMKTIEYIDLFTTEKTHMIDKYYQILSDNLDPKPKIFWDTLYDQLGPIVFMNPDIFHYIILDMNNYKYNFPLLEDKNREYLRENIDILKPNFINCNITKLPNILNEKYDIMYLSNIMNYSSDLYNEHEFKSLRMFKNLIYSLSEKLNNNGKIYCNYIYDILNDGIITKEIIDQVFNEKEFSYEKFIGYDDFLKQDAVLVYKK